MAGTKLESASQITRSVIQAYAADSPNALINSRPLLSDRLIKLFVGDATEPYLVTESVLTRASPYFAGAIRNEHFGDDNVGKLRFPEDDNAAWEVILVWMLRRRLPTEVVRNTGCDTIILMDCWVLADKYLMPELQDILMLSLMHRFESVVQWPVISRAFEKAAPGSKIRMLAAEEAIFKVYRDYKGYGRDDEQVALLDDLVRFPGAVMELIDARVGNKEKGCYGTSRFCHRYGGGGCRVKEFLVSERNLQAAFCACSGGDRIEDFWGCYTQWLDFASGWHEEV